MEALCLLCGSRKESVESTCNECGHVLREDELELAHLFSSAHLSEEELQEASERIASGERPAPRSRPKERGHDRGLLGREFALVFAGSLLLTPLWGFTLAWGFRGTRSRAAFQAFCISLGVVLALSAAWGVLYFRL